MNDLQRTRLAQARNSLEEARTLLEAGMDGSFVLSNLYYALYYSVIAVLWGGKTPETMQAVTFGLFEQRFIREGSFSVYADVIHNVLDLKPACGGKQRIVDRPHQELLVERTGRFILEVEQFLDT